MVTVCTLNYKYPLIIILVMWPMLKESSLVGSILRKNSILILAFLCLVCFLKFLDVSGSNSYYIRISSITLQVKPIHCLSLKQV